MIQHFYILPLDEIILDITSLPTRYTDAIIERDVGRREKYAANLSLLAVSPLDAYSRYTHSSELTKASHDPLWYAFSLLGYVESFIAMADMGGHGVDEYLDANFQYPEEIMTTLFQKLQALNVDTQSLERKFLNKCTLPSALYTLMDEVLGILCRCNKLVPLYVEVLLKLAKYIANEEDNHLQCRWGYSAGRNSGESFFRWKPMNNDLNISQDSLNISYYNNSINLKRL